MTNKFAKHYNKIFRDKSYKAEAIALGLLMKKGTVLDVGCGTGLHAQELIKLGFVVEGLEPHSVLYEQSKKLMTVYNNRIEDSDIQKTYDNVICMFQVLNYVDDAKLAIKRIHSLLNKNGKLIIDMLTEESQLKQKVWVWDWLYSRYITTERGRHSIWVNYNFPFLGIKDSFKHVTPPHKNIVGLLNDSGFTVDKIIFNGMDNLIICTAQ